MSDLISREDLKDYARTVLCEDSVTNASLIRIFDEIIDNAPTVEEVSVIEFKEPLPPVKAYKIIRALNKIPQGEQIAWEQGYECGKNENRPQGEWIEQRNYPFRYNCNKCGKENTHKSNFCECCGADMRGGAE